jgi:hypothetical protein
MTDHLDKIHVMPVAPTDWEVEEQSGEAVRTNRTTIEKALDLARETGSFRSSFRKDL